MSKVAKAAKPGKQTPEEASGWKPRITERALPSGAVSFMADWWERKEGGKGYNHFSKQFPTRAELDTWIAAQHKERADKREQKRREDELVREAERRGDNVVTLANLSSAERAALAQAVETIRAAGGRVQAITEAAEKYRQTHLQGAKTTIADVCREQLEEIRASKRPATYKDRRRNLAHLEAVHGGELVAAFGRATAREWIMAANTQSMRAARKRALHALFSFAWSKDYVKENPVAKIKVETPVREEVSILSPKDAEEVLRRAEKHAPALVPYLAIGLFAGLRPMNELRGLDWRDIDLAGGNITVRRASSKTNRARLVPISPNLRAWLETVPPSRRTGSIYYSRRLLDWIAGKEPRQDRRIAEPGKIKRAAKKKGKKTRMEFEPIPWGQDILRHTRTSFRLAQTKNAPMVAEEGGHTPTIMRQHYANRTIRAAEVEAFWNIMPTKAARKSKGK